MFALKQCYRPILAATAALGVLVSSSGCLKLDMALEVRSDDTVGGTFTAAWSEEFLSEMDRGGAALEQAELDAFFNALFEGIPESRRTVFEADGYVGQTATFTDQPLTDFAEFGGDEWGFLSIQREGREYALDGYWDLRYAAFLEDSGVEDAEILLSVNFPARVTDHNGELDGRTVSWRMTPGEEYRLTAEAVGYNGWLWLLISAAALLAVLALLWAWQWSRLRKYSLGARSDA